MRNMKQHFQSLVKTVFKFRVKTVNRPDYFYRIFNDILLNLGIRTCISRLNYTEKSLDERFTLFRRHLAYPSIERIVKKS